MTRRNRILAATAAVALVAGLGIAGTSVAQRAFGGSFGGHGGFAFANELGADRLIMEVDADRDGKITQAEIDRAVGARLDRFDADRNARLSLEEFTALWADITRPVAVRAFQFLDPDGDAAVSREELNGRFSRAVARFDRNGDGALSLEDRRGFDHGRDRRGGERGSRDRL